MRILLSALLLSFSTDAQTTGVPGVNDLTINGTGSGATSCHTAYMSAGPRVVNFAINSVPNSPIIIASGVCQPGAVPLGPAGSLDISPLTFAIILDGLSGLPAPFLLPWTSTNAAGLWSLGIAVNLPSGPVGTLQGGVINPSFPTGLALTQASRLFGVSLGALPLCPTTIGNNLAPLTDDGAVLLTLSSPFSFYGSTHNTVYVNMNGNLTFGLPNPDFSPSQADLIGSQPRITGVWDDWVPSDPAQGTVRALDNGTTLRVEWFDVRHFNFVACGLNASGFQDSNTFCIELDYATGGITLRFGVMALCSGGVLPSLDQVVGISPGFGLSAVNNVDLSAGPSMGLTPLTAIYEDFGLATFGAFDLGPSWGAINGLTFTSAVPGVGPYTATPF